MHDAIPARDREATGDSFTNRAITSYNSSVYVCGCAGMSAIETIRKWSICDE